MKDWLKNAWQGAVYAFKPAIKTAAFTFLGLFIPALIGWVNDLYNAVSTQNTTLPGVSTLGQAAASAALAAAAGLVSFGWRWLQQMGMPLGEIPRYVKAENTLPGPVPTTLPADPVVVTPATESPLPPPAIEFDPDMPDPEGGV